MEGIIADLASENGLPSTKTRMMTLKPQCATRIGPLLSARGSQTRLPTTPGESL